MRKVAEMEVEIEQFAKSTKDISDIMTLIQAILDDPAVRALLETIVDCGK